jgi:hypothetical protein
MDHHYISHWPLRRHVSLQQMAGKSDHISYIKEIIAVLAVFIGYLTPVWSFDMFELTTKAV